MFRLTITVKVTVFICAITLLVVGVGLFLGYQWGSALLLSTVQQNQLNVSALTLRYLAELFEHKISFLEGYALSPMWISAVKTANFNRGAGEERRDIQTILLNLDTQWRKAGKEEALVKECLEKGKNLGLMGLMGADADIGEIFLTDKYGAIVACSEKTSDFYQGDEEWWQVAFNEGRGDIFIGNFAFDESAGFWSFTVALPIVDETGTAIGVCKAIIDLKRFFSPLNIFRVSQSGEFTLVDKTGVIIYHYGLNPFTASFCSATDFNRILQSTQRQGIVFSPIINKNVFVVLTDLNYPFLMERKIDLKILISQDATEVLKPLNTLFSQRILISMLLLALMIILGFISGHTLTGPIKKLHRASLLVAKGDYAVKTGIKTNDELQELSNVFDDMVISIKEKQERLQAQTTQLSEAQKQTLEALNEIKEKQKQIEAYSQELEHSNRELEQFAYIVSHDLQEPLRMIAGYLQLLETRYKGKLGKDADEFIAYVVDGAQRMRVLIDTILAYSRIASAEIELTPVDCQQLLTTVLINLTASITERKAVVTHDPLPTVTFDMTQLSQLFQNLLGNAIKYSKKEAPKIHISIQQKEDEWVFSVKDNGIGIAQKDLQRIFQIFQRADTRGTQSGSGIGLAVCKKIIERHGGRIWAESELGKGSVFYFTIPI